MYRTLVPIAVTVLLAGCAAFGMGAVDPPVDLIAQLPTQFDGDLYFDHVVDGSCSTDCPDPSAARGWLVPCDQLDASAQALERHLESLGYQPDGEAADDSRWFTRTDDAGRAGVTGYTDASVGSNPNVPPFESPASVSGRCSVLLYVTRPRA